MTWEPITPLRRVRSWLPRVTFDGRFVWFGYCYRRILYNPTDETNPYRTQYLSRQYVDEYAQHFDIVED